MGTRIRTDYGRVMGGTWLFHGCNKTGRAQGWRAKRKAALKSTTCLAPTIRAFGIR